jgi:magnesium chelatase subunit D
MEAWNLIRTERLRDPGLEPLLVVLSDGEANVPLQRGRDPLTDLYLVAHRIRRDKIHGVAIDTRTDLVGSGEMPGIAEALGASYHPIDALRVSAVVEVVQAAQDVMD